MEAIIKIVDTIGYLGPTLLFFFSIYILFSKLTTLSVFLLGFFLNVILNNILKGIIRQPRPGEDKRLFNLKLMSKNKVNRIGHDIFGMPSGHAQLTFYVSSFIFFTLKDKWIPMMYFIVSLITLYQRVKYKNHTFEQVVIGAIVGIIMGYAFSLYNKRVLSGEPSAKKDDNYFGFL